MLALFALAGGSSSGGGMVRVKWQSRTVGFANGPVETIIEKAADHFGLGPRRSDLVLLATVQGEEIEVSNDILRSLPKGTVFTLSRFRLREQLAPPSGRLWGTATSEEAKTSKGKEAEVGECKEVEVGKSKEVEVGKSKEVEAVGYEAPPAYDGPSMLPPADVKTPAGMFVWVLTQTGKWYAIGCSPSDTIRTLKERLHAKGAPLPHLHNLVFAGQQLDDTRTVADYTIPRGSVVNCAPRVNARKPVIYLFPPHPIADATISVSLVPQWSFSHVYPLSAPKVLENGGQRVEWAVSARPDGTLVEKGSMLELSYLFWEAVANASAPPSPPLQAADARADSDSEYFDPAYPVLDCDTPTAVLLPFVELLPYLDETLKKLSLHTAARNDFITYWLPELSKEPFVALRFLPQAAYERAASLEVTPKPDVVTRVFMLFRGVSAEDADHSMWSGARARVGQVDWAKIVGVEAGVGDETLFRVLEWGALEIL